MITTHPSSSSMVWSKRHLKFLIQNSIHWTPIHLLPLVQVTPYLAGLSFDGKLAEIIVVQDVTDENRFKFEGYRSNGDLQVNFLTIIHTNLSLTQPSHHLSQSLDYSINPAMKTMRHKRIAKPNLGCL